MKKLYISSLVFLFNALGENVNTSIFANSMSASSATTFKVTVNTTKQSGGTGAISRGVRKFVVHASYNPNTHVNVYVALNQILPLFFFFFFTK